MKEGEKEEQEGKRKRRRMSWVGGEVQIINITCESMRRER